MNRFLSSSSIRALQAAAALAAGASTVGCSSGGGLFGTHTFGAGGGAEYRTAPAQTKPLSVPPDLSQLARDTRYTPQSGVVSAAAVAAAGSAPVSNAATEQLAPGQRGSFRIERDGQSRWLQTPLPPEQLWPQLRSFWEKSGFTLDVDEPSIGLMETNWSENRAKVPKDALGNLIGGLLGSFVDSGERDRFRTRVERSAAGTEVYITHRGIAEVYADARNETTTWKSRPEDPGLEAEFLARLMLALGGKPDADRASVAPAVAAVTVAPEPPPRARLVSTAKGAALEVDEPFERAWRRVGLALDRGTFTVEDRDRAQGLYYVRYVDPRSAGEDEPNFLVRLFSDAKDPKTPVRYRIALESSGAKTLVSVLTSAGAPEPGENGKRIVARLVNELK